jgi:hypothetical protein
MPNGPLVDPNPQFQQFAADAFRSPAPVLNSHLFDQGNRLCGYPRMTRLSLGFLSPKQLEALAMPLQQGVRFHDQQRVFPFPHPTRQQYQQPAVFGSKFRRLRVACDDNQLLPQERVLDDQLRFALHQVRCCTP